MENRDFKYFEFLKQKIVATLRRTYPGVSTHIHEWKGQSISFFQEDLLTHVNDQISEKWFYIHFKSRTTKLPRVDILDMLSKYVGYKDWGDFKYENKDQIESEIHKKTTNPNRMFIVVPAIMLLILTIFYLIYSFSSTRDYQLCFVNADTMQPIEMGPISISLFHKDGSTNAMNLDEEGCLQIKTDQIIIRFAIDAPYYINDTIERTLKKFDRIETIPIRTDDYALMIDYFSKGKVLDWKKRRQQLDEMIAENARIFEVHQTGVQGVELYNKWEFIDKLSIPSLSLKQIQILDTEYLNNQIIGLRFTSKK